MRAITIHRWGKASELRCEDVPQPVPGAGQALVKIRYASLNPIDYKIRNGRFHLFMDKKFPKILGLEASGTIVETGAGLSGLLAGTPVFIQTSRKFRMGCYAEYAVVDADRILSLPTDFDLKAGSALAVAPATALQGLRDHGRVKPGSRVLINGASGSVGLCAVQIAKQMGAHVTGVCSTRNTDLVQKNGADRVIDYLKMDFAALSDHYDLVFDCVSTRSFSECRRVLAPNGRYVNLMLRPLDLLWQKIRNPFSRQKFITFVMKYRKDDLNWVIQQVQSGLLTIPMDTVFPLEKAQQAQVRLESGRATGKILLEVVE